MNRNKWIGAVVVVIMLMLFGGCSSVGEEQEATNEPQVNQEREMTNEADEEAESLTEKNEAESVLTQMFQMPELEVFEYVSPYFEKSAGILSLEEAAAVGAEYIWEVLGVDLDDLSLQLTYTSPVSLNGSWWMGSFGTSRETIENQEVMYLFLIDAHSGQRIDLIDMETPEVRRIAGIDLAGTMEAVAGDREMSDEFVAPTLDELLVYQELAEAFAMRHFNETSVVEIEPHPTLAFNPLGFLIFLATDETGRVAEVRIQMETKALMAISTQHNDNADTNIGGGTG